MNQTKPDSIPLFPVSIRTTKHDSFYDEVEKTTKSEAEKASASTRKSRAAAVHNQSERVSTHTNLDTCAQFDRFCKDLDLNFNWLDPALFAPLDCLNLTINLQLLIEAYLVCSPVLGIDGDRQETFVLVFNCGPPVLRI